MANKLWEEVDRLTQGGMSPVIRIGPRVKVAETRGRKPVHRWLLSREDPTHKRYRIDNRNAYRYRTQYQDRRCVPTCMAPQCKNKLKINDVLVCSEKCRQFMLNLAEFISNTLTNPPLDRPILIDHIPRLRPDYGIKRTRDTGTSQTIPGGTPTPGTTSGDGSG